MTYPNQLRIKVHKPTYDEKYVKENGAFMQIGVDEWTEAFRNLEGNPSAMGMYLYLASNADGFEKYLSCKDFEKVTGKSRSSYHRGIGLLKEQGYIYKDASGSFNFETAPQKNTEVKLHNWEECGAEMKQKSSKSDTDSSQICNASVPKLDIEINIDKEQQTKTNSFSSSKDYSYLDKIISYDDGSYKWKGKSCFIDGNDMFFYDRPRRWQEARMAEITPFKMAEIQYILDRMADNGGIDNE